MTGSNAEIEWFIARDGQQHGPLSDAEMRLFVESGHLKGTDLLWRVGFTDWRPASSVFPPRAPVEPQPRTQPPAAQRQPHSNAASQAHPATQPAQQTQTAARTHAPAAVPTTANTSQRPTVSNNAAAAGNASRNEPRQDLVPVGNARTGADYESEPRQGRGKVIALSVLMLALIGGAVGYVATHTSSIMQLAGLSKPADKVPVVKAEPAVTAALKKPEAQMPAPAAQAAMQAPAPIATATATPAAAVPAPSAPSAAPPAATGALAKIDAQYQKSRLWSFMKREYPEWYGQNVAQAARLIDAQKPDRDATRHMIEAMVALRRKNAELALKADTAKLKSIAAAFLENLQSLSEKGPDACYGFISQGEVSPAAIDLFHQPQSAPALEMQAMAIFEAIGAGQRTPTAHDRPKKEDYDVLAAQLGKLGWSQADLQMFADPKALSAAPPARVCQMVRDWFKAHVEITDGAVQERLLFETLRPVVAG